MIWSFGKHFNNFSCLENIVDERTDVVKPSFPMTFLFQWVPSSVCSKFPKCSILFQINHINLIWFISVNSTSTITSTFQSILATTKFLKSSFIFAQVYTIFLFQGFSMTFNSIYVKFISYFSLQINLLYPSKQNFSFRLFSLLCSLYCILECAL